jgi:hypothetical protein
MTDLISVMFFCHVKDQQVFRSMTKIRLDIFVSAQVFFCVIAFIVKQVSTIHLSFAVALR